MKILIFKETKMCHFKATLQRIALVICLSSPLGAAATQLLTPMDNSQSNHLKAYGIAYWTLENGVVIEWLLNYKGGSWKVEGGRIWSKMKIKKKWKRFQFEVM